MLYWLCEKDYYLKAFSVPPSVRDRLHFIIPGIFRLDFSDTDAQSRRPL